MYCPNCGETQKEEHPKDCWNCGLPLGSVDELLAANKEAIEAKERKQRMKMEKYAGAALFVALAAGPIAWGLINSLSSGSAAKPAKELPPGEEGLATTVEPVSPAVQPVPQR